MFKWIIRFGLPSGLQNSIISIANVVVQANVNAFGSITMELTTFIGQNLGAREYERTLKGARFGINCSMLIAEAIGVLTFIFAPSLIAAFDSNPDVIQFEIDRARTSALFFCLLAFSHCVSAILRGAGKSSVPMIVMLVCWCLICVSFLTIMMKIYFSIELVYLVYPLTWTLSTIVFAIYYKKANWLHTYLIENYGNKFMLFLFVNRLTINSVLKLVMIYLLSIFVRKLIL